MENKLVLLGQRAGRFIITRLLPAALLITSPIWFLFVLVELLNTETKERNSQKLQLSATPQPQSKTPVVELVLHRIVPDENAIETSIVIHWRYSDVPKELTDRDNCATVLVGDRAISDVPFVARVSLSCKRTPTPINMIDERISAESSTFRLTTYASVHGFPFDEIYVLPWMHLTLASGVYIEPVYLLERRFPSKTVYIRSFHPNSDVGIRRTDVEKAFVIGSAAIFMLVTLFITIRLCAKDVKLTGVQEIIAIAGFLLATNSFRDLVGVSHTTGRSAFEVLVFGFALVAPTIGIAFSAWRNR